MTMQQPMYGTAPMFVFGDYPMPCTCPNCRQQIVTRIEKQNGLLTWIVMGFLVLLCCWCGCCLIPLCIDTYKVKHSIFMNISLIDLLRTQHTFVQIVLIHWV